MASKITHVKNNITLPFEVNNNLHVTRMRHTLYEYGDMPQNSYKRILVTEIRFDKEIVTDKVKASIVERAGGKPVHAYAKNARTMVVTQEDAENNTTLKINVPYYISDDQGVKQEQTALFTYTFDNVPDPYAFSLPPIEATKTVSVPGTYPITVADDLHIQSISYTDEYDNTKKVTGRKFKVTFDKDITSATAQFNNLELIGSGSISVDHKVVTVEAGCATSFVAALDIEYDSKQAVYTLTSEGKPLPELKPQEFVIPSTVKDLANLSRVPLNPELLVEDIRLEGDVYKITIAGGYFYQSGTARDFGLANDKYGIPVTKGLPTVKPSGSSTIEIRKSEHADFPDKIAAEVVYYYRGEVRKVDVIFNLKGAPRQIIEYGGVYAQINDTLAITEFKVGFDLDKYTTTMEITFNRDVTKVEYDASTLGTITAEKTNSDSKRRLVLNKVRNFELPIKITYNDDNNLPIGANYVLNVEGAPKVYKHYTAGNYTYETYKNAVVISYNVLKDGEVWKDNGTLIANKATVNGTDKEVDNTPYDNYSPIENITHSVYNEKTGKYQFIIKSASPTDAIVLDYENGTHRGTITLDIADFNEFHFNFERSRFEHSEAEGKTLAFFQTNRAPTDVFIQKSNVEKHLLTLSKQDRDIKVAYDYGSFFNDDLQLYALLDNTKAYVQLDITGAPAEVPKTERTITIEKIIVTNTVGNDITESLFDSPSKTETKIIIDPTANNIDAQNFEEIFGLRTIIKYNGKASVNSEILKENGKLVLIFKDRLVSTDNFEITSVRNRIYVIPRFSDNFVTSRTIKHNIDDENSTVTIAFSKTLPAVTYGNEARLSQFDVKQTAKELIFNTPKGKYLENINELPTMVFTYNSEKTVEVWKWIKVPPLPLDKNSIKLQIIATGFDQCTLFHYLDFTIADTQNVLEFNKGYKVNYCKIVDKLIKGNVERVVRLPKETPDTYRILFSEYPIVNGGFIKLVPYTKDDAGDQASNPRVTAYLPLTVNEFPKPANKEKDVNTCAIYLKPNSDVALKDFLYQVHTRDLLDKKKYSITAELLKTEVNNDTAVTTVQVKINGEHERVNVVLQGIPAQAVEKQPDGTYIARIAAKAKKGQNLVVTTVNSDGDVASYNITIDAITYKDITVEVLGGTVFTDLSGALLKVRIYPKPLKVEGVLGTYKTLGQGTDTEGVYQILYNTRVNYTDILTVNIDIDDLNKRFVKYPVRLLDQINLHTNNRGETAKCANQVRPVKQPIYIFYGTDDMGVNELTVGDIAMYGRVIYILDNKTGMTKDSNVADAIARKNLIPLIMNNYIKDMHDSYNATVLGKLEKVEAQIKEVNNAVVGGAGNRIDEAINKATADIANATKRVQDLLAKLEKQHTDDSTTLPVGTVIAIANNTPKIPDGFLLCNGAAVEREKYKKLFEVIGTTYGAGDNTTTFNLPDFRGCFLRGQGGNSADFGVVQGDAIRNITGKTAFCSDENGSNGVGPNLASGAFSTEGAPPANIGDNDGSRAGGIFLVLDASKVVPTANENRPVNYAVHYLICYGKL